MIIDGGVAPQLLQATWTLRDTGQDAAAETLACILLERFNLSDTIREQLESLASRMSVPIVSTLRSYIQQKSPFVVDYRSATGKACQYTVRYAELGGFPGERYNYLKCWVDEANEYAEIEGLAHNYTLNLNRIISINSVGDNDWRSVALDKILVEFMLIGNWVGSYESSVDDVVPRPPIINGKLYVSRYVSFWHFFKRDIIRYGADCKIVAPVRAVESMRAEIRKMLANYQTKTG